MVPRCQFAGRRRRAGGEEPHGPGARRHQLRGPRREILGIGGLPESGKDVSAKRCSVLANGAAAVAIDGKDLRASDPRASIREGMSFVPADRRGAGALRR